MRITILLLACFVGSTQATEPVIPADKAVITFQTKTGVVTFHHQAHSDLSFTKCTSCHHTLKPEEKVKPCGECHVAKPKDKDTPKTKKAFHKRCTGCHEYTAEKGEPAGPLKKKCKLCHVK